MKLHSLFIGSNQKMYKTTAETVEFLTRLQKLTDDLSRQQLTLFINVPYTALAAAVMAVDQDKIMIGSQNMFWKETGQYTGEISPLMLKETGIRLVELGHSERREHFGDTDLVVNKKVSCSLNHGFQTLLCVGETAEDKALGITDEHLRIQVKVGLHGVPEKNINKVWMAYEPAWAIGVHGVPAAPEYANHKQAVIRQALVELYPDQGHLVPVLYGGSVNLENAVPLIQQPAIDGLFIGRTAWEADRFSTLIHQVVEAWKNK